MGKSWKTPGIHSFPFTFFFRVCVCVLSMNLFPNFIEHRKFMMGAKHTNTHRTNGQRAANLCRLIEFSTTAPAVRVCLLLRTHKTSFSVLRNVCSATMTSGISLSIDAKYLSIDDDKMKIQIKRCDLFVTHSHTHARMFVHMHFRNGCELLDTQIMCNSLLIN